MGFGSIVTMLVIGANIVLLVLFFASQSSGAKADPEIANNGKKVIRPSKSLLWFSILLAIWALLGVYLGLDAMMRERVIASSILVALLLIGATAPFSLWMLIRYLRYRIVWDDKTIEVTNWFNKISSYRWDDLLELAQRNSETTVRDPIYPGITPVRVYDLELRFKKDEKIRAAPNMTGYYAFVEDAAKYRDMLDKNNPGG